MNDCKKTQVEHQAAKYVARVLSGDESMSVDAWEEIGDDKQLAQEYVCDFFQVDAALDALKLDTDIGNALSQAQEVAPQTHEPRRFDRTWAVAASVILGLGVLLGGWLAQHQRDDFGVVNRYVTQIGEQREVLLSDGSSMVLNTGTEVLVNMDTAARNITLKRGEVYFDVSKDPDRVFTVEVGNHAVGVLGTAFNLKQDGNVIDLAVDEGLVVFYPRSETPDPGAESVGSEEEEHILAGAQRRVAAGWRIQLERDVLAASQFNEELTWRSGILHFTERPLVDVVKELNRYSVKRILIEDPSVMSTQVSASINVKRIPSILKLIAKAYDLHVEEGFDYILIKSDEPE